MVKRLHFIPMLILPALLLSPVWAAKMYKWTDEDGNVHYSDKLPPDAVKKEHRELNDQGVTTRTVNRDKTEQERLEEAAAQAAKEQEEKRLAEEVARQRARDELLLDTFTTERDLLLAREDRLEAIDSLINLTTNNNATLEQQADAARKRIENLKKGDKEVPENFVKQLENLEGQLAKNKAFIEDKRQERIKLEQQFDEDLKRYRELKGTADGTAAATAASPQAAQAAAGPGEIKTPPASSKP